MVLPIPPRDLNVIGALALAVTDAQEGALERFARPRSDLEALLAVCERPGQRISDLAAVLGLTHSAAVRVADRLEARGEVERSEGRDRRAVGLRPTPRGHAAARSVLEARTSALRTVLGGLDPPALASLAGVADRVLRSRPRRREEAWRTCRLCAHDVCRGRDCPVGSSVP